MQIASIYETQVKLDEPERIEHDANLIASAPQLLADNTRLRAERDRLLEACKGALAYVEFFVNAGEDLTKLRQAIDHAAAEQAKENV